MYSVCITYLITRVFLITKYIFDYYSIKNYTQLVWADTWRIGCAAAKYDNGFALVCNYHAMTTVEDVAWKIGQPCSRCPRNLPLRSLDFDSLCTGGE